MFKKTIILIFIFLGTIFANSSTTDSDFDSISDQFDKCPNTPDGVLVDQNGCTQIIKNKIQFDSSSYQIKDEYKDKINSVKEIAKECFGYKIEIIGHTDSTADESYNKLLSKNRALSVRKELIDAGIDSKRITIDWYGELMPIATNVTKEGRFLNRRTEILFK
jgi:OOP family OmpA-OmpF porin